MTVRTSLSQIRRAIYEFAGNPRYSRPALYDLDRRLGRYLRFRNGIFVEAGANDGFTQSNTYYLERFLGWSGLLVEAIPSLCERGKAMSAAQPGFQLRSCAFSEGGPRGRSWPEPQKVDVT